MNTQPADRVFYRDYPVLGHEAGIAGNLKFASLLNFLQDAAGAHAAELGVAIEFLRARNLMWVLSRSHIELTALPQVGDTVRLRTWPAGWHRLFAIRDFDLARTDGSLFGRATSAWLIIRADNHLPVRALDVIGDLAAHPERSIVDDFARIPLPHRIDSVFRCRALMQDLDINGHVNNAVYGVWALESVPPAVWQTHRPVGLTIQFCGMAFAGDPVLGQACELPPPSGTAGHRQFLHAIRHANSGQLWIRACSRWAAVDTAGVR
jgi:medium-chain acyl-[acyl-carrier-protein] hydrolase